jgi:hypothetical protein
MKSTRSFATFIAFLFATPLVTSVAVEVEKRALYSTCDTWGTITEGSFTVFQVCGPCSLGWMHPPPLFRAMFTHPASLEFIRNERSHVRFSMPKP